MEAHIPKFPDLWARLTA